MSAPQQTAVGLCRRCGEHPRRMRRGAVEPLCQGCYEAALKRVAGDLQNEHDDAKRRWAGKAARPSPGEDAPTPAQQAPSAARVSAEKAPTSTEARGPGRPTLIGEPALAEARRLYGLGLSMRAVAESVLEDTGYANAESAAVALRRQFRKHGWPVQRRQGWRSRARDEQPAKAA